MTATENLNGSRTVGQEKTKWKKEDRREAVSAYIYIMEHPEEFNFNKKKRLNEGASRVVRLLDQAKGRGWQDRTAETTLRHWVAAYFNAHPKEKPPKGVKLMTTTLKWSSGEISRTPPDWVFNPDPGVRPVGEQAQAGPSAGASGESPSRERTTTPKKKSKSSAKRGERKRSRDSSEEKDPTVKWRFTKPRYDSPIPEEAAVDEAPNGSNEASSRAAQDADGEKR